MFFRMLRACPPVHTFWKYFEGYKKERKYEIEKHFLSTYPHFQIMKFNIIFLDFFYICPPVHIFCKILKGTRKKENMKLQDSFWELSQTKILKGLTLSQWGGGDK